MGKPGNNFTAIRNRFISRDHALYLALSIAVLACLPGCDAGKAPSGPNLNDAVQVISAEQADTLRQRLDRVLLDNLHNRRLNTQQHAAWQILHGVLAYGQAFQVETPAGMQPAAIYLLGGGEANGWDLVPGDLLASTGRQGVRVVLRPGGFIGQGHVDQWLAILAQGNIPMDTPIRLGDQNFTMADLVHQAQADASRNSTREFSWSLIGLPHYLPQQRHWTAADGTTWSWEKMVLEEVAQDLDSSACGGTHRLIGLANAFRSHRQNLGTAGSDSQAWKAAEQLISDSILRARELQNSDGSLSTNYLVRPGNSSDLGTVIGTTGHMVEFLANALSDEQLDDAWVLRAVNRLCDVLEITQQVDLDCGSLYHALHGLAIYRDRRFGELDYNAALAAN